MKKIFLFLVLFTMFRGLSYAVNPNSCEVSCTPTVTYSVSIDTPVAGFAFGNVNLNSSYVYTTTATIKNNGGVSADWTIKGAALNNWVLGTAPANNTVRLMGVLKSSLAVVGDFNTTNDVIGGTESNMSATNYSVDQNGNDVPVNGPRVMSVRLDTPTNTSADTQQKFKIEITAYQSSRF